VTGPAPAVARVRSAVRAAIRDLPPGSLVLVAASGGRDSLALAAALAFEAPHAALRAGALVVDHGLQPDSADVAARVRDELGRLGLDPVEVLRVAVGTDGGPEAAARQARYDALEAAAARLGAAAVLLGHTLDDQAETVLLGLARGSGSRSLSGMSPSGGIYRRPLLGIDRETTGTACEAEGLTVWDDPHNVSHAFTRVRVRDEVMPVLERELGPGVAHALSRTAWQLRDDDDALEQWAASVGQVAAAHTEPGLDCETLAGVPAAVRRRVVRRAALAVGVAAHALRHSQLQAVDALVSAWHGQGPVDLPGGIQVVRTCGRLTFVVADGTAPVPPPSEDMKE
jgi:tRNA(Ile)-lysidine synthase